MTATFIQTLQEVLAFNLANTVVYVVDTGVDISHKEFEGRAFNGFSVFNDDFTDENGHGTHVSGTVF